MREGCEAARSGRFQVIVSVPLLGDGSWKRLHDIAKLYELCFEVIVWAQNFDFSEWVAALNDGAFDVLDAMHEQPRVAEVAKLALWAASVKRAKPRLRVMDPWDLA